MSRRLVLLGALALAAAAAGLASALARDGGAKRDPARPPLAAAAQLCEAGGGQSMVATCYQRKLLAAIDASRDPSREVPRIGAFARAHGGYLDENCHILMHAVGRAYALEHRLSLATLQYALPRSNDPNCSAGFAHGVVMALGPQVLAAGSRAATVACGRVATRYEQYSCVHGLGHAYMRMTYEDLPQALGSCLRLGPRFAPDCAQGAFHDYWLSVSGSDQTRQAAHPVLSPRALCKHQRAIFVQPCWYRAYMELVPPVRLGTAAALLELCRGLGGLQRAGCVTAGSVESSSDPYEQLRICAGLSAKDAVSCAHGVRAQALAGRPLRQQVRLVELCARFPPRARLDCVHWLGKAFAVVTNGSFTAGGCAALPAPARPVCTRGGRSAGGALVTFS